MQWEPVNQDSSRAASKAAFGSYADAQYKLENADVILSLDADFLGGIGHPGFLPLAAGYAERHRYEEGKAINRLYVVETMPTVTGFKAEHRLSLKPSQIAQFADALVYGTAPSGLSAEQQKFFTAVLSDLKKNSGKAVVIPGEQALAFGPRCSLRDQYSDRRRRQDGDLYRDGQSAPERAGRRLQGAWLPI